MKTIKIDQLNRVHIPKKAMEELSWNFGDKLNYILEGDRLVLSKEEPNKICPVCKRSFKYDYDFCPYDGQYLSQIKKDDDSNK